MDVDVGTACTNGDAVACLAVARDARQGWLEASVRASRGEMPAFDLEQRLVATGRWYALACAYGSAEACAEQFTPASPPPPWSPSGGTVTTSIDLGPSGAVAAALPAPDGGHWEGLTAAHTYVVGRWVDDEGPSQTCLAIGTPGAVPAVLQTAIPCAQVLDFVTVRDEWLAFVSDDQVVRAWIDGTTAVDVQALPASPEFANPVVGPDGTVVFRTADGVQVWPAVGESRSLRLPRDLWPVRWDDATGAVVFHGIRGPSVLIDTDGNVLGGAPPEPTAELPPPAWASALKALPPVSGDAPGTGPLDFVGGNVLAEDRRSFQADFLVTLRRADRSGEPRSTKTDAEGHWEFADVPAGEWVVAVERPSDGAAWSIAVTGPHVYVNLDEVERCGFAIDAEGSPSLAGARVEVTPIGRAEPIELLTPPIVGDSGYVQTFWGSNLRDRRLRVTLADGQTGVQDVSTCRGRIVVGPQAITRVVVEDLAGKRVPDAAVSWSGAGYGDLPNVPVSTGSDGSATGPGFPLRAIDSTMVRLSDASGSFTFRPGDPALSYADGTLTLRVPASAPVATPEPIGSLVRTEDERVYEAVGGSVVVPLTDAPVETWFIGAKAWTASLHAGRPPVWTAAPSRVLRLVEPSGEPARGRYIGVGGREHHAWLTTNANGELHVPTAWAAEAVSLHPFAAHIPLSAGDEPIAVPAWFAPEPLIAPFTVAADPEGLRVVRVRDGFELFAVGDVLARWGERDLVGVDPAAFADHLAATWAVHPATAEVVGRGAIAVNPPERVLATQRSKLVGCQAGDFEEHAAPWPPASWCDGRPASAFTPWDAPTDKALVGTWDLERTQTVRIEQAITDLAAIVASGTLESLDWAAVVPDPLRQLEALALVRQVGAGPYDQPTAARRLARLRAVEEDPTTLVVTHKKRAWQVRLASDGPRAVSTTRARGVLTAHFVAFEGEPGWTLLQVDADTLLVADPTGQLRVFTRRQ